MNNRQSNFKYKIPPIKERVSNIIKKTTNAISSNSNINNSNKPPLSYNILIIFIIILLLILIAYVGYYVLITCDYKKTLYQYFIDGSLNPCVKSQQPQPKSDLDASLDYSKRVLTQEKEVFHIANQDYTYEQAKCKCAAYGGRLATKNEIIEAYNRGAEWCSYGWSEGQAAYYPTQKCTWDKLQKDPNHKNDCGLPGVNGGFFSNPNLKFGINCYGIKPKGEVVQEKPAVCEKPEFCKQERNYRAANRLDTDEVMPFNGNKWSEFD